MLAAATGGRDHRGSVLGVWWFWRRHSERTGSKLKSAVLEAGGVFQLRVCWAYLIDLGTCVCQTREVWTVGPAAEVNLQIFSDRPSSLVHYGFTVATNSSIILSFCRLLSTFKKFFRPSVFISFDSAQSLGPVEVSSHWGDFFVTWCSTQEGPVLFGREKLFDFGCDLALLK